jgi:hypothetical protein
MEFSCVYDHRRQVDSNLIHGRYYRLSLPMVTNALTHSSALFTPTSIRSL